ncbi:thioredoxin domain-containing protein 15 [Bombina bombina]|uniref:thioredoxin domain-containing protein 15 n=1 Tax=Bombina bombina TaxID=8345 RepID=UPI00235AC266|nr:thioredoxin domain-containing protein 15 [Bombina bombina]
MGPFLRVLVTCSALCLLLLSVVRGSQSDPEVDSKSFIPLSQETESFLSENIEDVHIHEPIQYKTAEIADAMQSTDIQTDPVVLLSMVPGQIRDKAEVDATVSVCNGAKDGVDCGASEKDPADANERTKSQTNESLPEELKTEESNTTDNGKALKVNCEERNITGIENFTLQILNVSQDLMEFLNPNSSECTLALFYIPWCRFSASLAPHFNSLPRAFPTLHFVALDASQHSSLSTRFGTVAVPNILLFQGAKPMARFNHTERTFDALKAFIYNQSGIEAKPDIVISEADCEGPLPCEPIEGIDWLLVFSCLYVTIFILYATVQTESIRWLIPGQEHEHQE